LGAEQVMQLEPMRLPSPAEQTDVARLARVESVALFVQRARRADHRFALTEANAASVAEIVALLEGSPLAIELASARVRLLPVDRMALRLKRDARFLRGPVDAPERHRTLRQAVAWSVRLLPPPERRLFVRLSVFAGGFTMDAAEAVCEDDGVPDVWEAMESLVDKSLVRRRPDGGGRLSMLDAMRRYGDDALRSGGRHERYASRHARWVAQAFAEAAPELTRAGQRDAWARLAPEHANLRVALEHLASSGQLEQAVRLAHDAWRFWHAGGRLAEGRGLLEGLLQRGS
jgi:non-specific serine/threonine protein kinase